MSGALTLFNMWCSLDSSIQATLWSCVSYSVFTHLYPLPSTRSTSASVQSFLNAASRFPKKGARCIQLQGWLIFVDTTQEELVPLDKNTKGFCFYWVLHCCSKKKKEEKLSGKSFMLIYFVQLDNLQKSTPLLWFFLIEEKGTKLCLRANINNKAVKADCWSNFVTCLSPSLSRHVKAWKLAGGVLSDIFIS